MMDRRFFSPPVVLRFTTSTTTKAKELNKRLSNLISKSPLFSLHQPLSKSSRCLITHKHLLFGEIVTAQKVMYEKFSDKFLAHFVTKGFLAAHCSQDLAEQYHQNLQGNDMKPLRSFYQSVVENMRFQQNGSLVFR